MTHEETTQGLHGTADASHENGTGHSEVAAQEVGASQGLQIAKTPDRDLATVIDAMLAEIPEKRIHLRARLRWLQIVYTNGVEDKRQFIVDVASSLVEYAASPEPWYDRVMAIWSGEAPESTKCVTCGKAMRSGYDPPFGPDTNCGGDCWECRRSLRRRRKRWRRR